MFDRRRHCFVTWNNMVLDTDSFMASFWGGPGLGFSIKSVGWLEISITKPIKIFGRFCHWTHIT